MALNISFVGRPAAVAAVLLAACSCSQTLKLMKDDSATVLSQQTITAQNPADKGTFAVKTLFYGSGTDKQRPEFGKDVTIKTKTVDVSPFATIPKPAQKSRLKFWGFDLKKAPINGRVWSPASTSSATSRSECLSSSPASSRVESAWCRRSSGTPH